jgi:hypothetical protein
MFIGIFRIREYRGPKDAIFFQNHYYYKYKTEYYNCKTRPDYPNLISHTNSLRYR